jgi:voltage-gated potassium channel
VKSLGLILSLLTATARQRNVRLLVGLLTLFVALVTMYSVVFHILMDREGQSHSWPTSVYWTLVTMTTLGFGDITFTSDAGRVFSVVVLLSGSLFLLVLLPFTFIQFVFIPWMSRREQARAPRELPPETRDHLVFTGLGPIEDALIRRAERAGVAYVVMVGDLEEALRLHDRGYAVMVGDLDDPKAYRAARADQAGMVAATRTDTTNANITFTVREMSDVVPIVATASKSASVDILELAGADVVLQLGDMLGDAMAARTLAPDGLSHSIGEFAGMQIAQARVAGTDLVGKSLAEAGLRSRLGVGIIGVWEHGEFEIAGPETQLGEGSVLILAAEPDAIERYDRAYGTGSTDAERVVVIGGGRVGRAAARSVIAHGGRAVIVEQRSERIRDPELYVLGDAADLDVLVNAGVREATAVLITTHDDDVNIYLALYIRRLRPDVRIVGRANLDRNVSTLYRAGADDVLSYAATGAAAIWNHFSANDTLLVAEGLNVFQVDVPPSLVGTTLAKSGIRRATGCNVVAIEQGGVVHANPNGTMPLTADAHLVLIADAEGEARFAERHPPPGRFRRAITRQTDRAGAP